jgi:O-glycosyl hydrolase
MKILAILLSIVLANHSCTKDNDIQDPADSFITISLNFNDQRQEINSFGASDAWSTQFVGKNWPLEKRQQIAELLFSMEEDDQGNPRGAGLSGWRFNIGAGSAEQGAASEIYDEWRRAECFLNADGSFNWDKQQGQRWFLQSARDYGLDDITVFVNSPPVHFTKNGKAWSAGGNSANLSEERYEDFAVFMATVVEELTIRNGVDIKYVSPVNEPQWDWDNRGQEGSPYTNAEIARVAKLLSEKMIQRGLPMQLEITDAAHIAYLYKYGDKPQRGNQAHEFFAAESENYLGDLSNLAYKITGHSYYSTYPVSTMLQERMNLNEAITQIDANLEFCQTEYCILEGNEEINGNGRDLGIDPALYTARLIHFDLTVAQSSTWYWWLAVSPYDYKDGLVYIDKDKNDGTIYDSKILWALGNYSRFVRPGMHRYQVIRSDNQSDEMSSTGLMVSGYGSPDKSKAVFVMVNYSKTVTYPIKLKTIDNREATSVKIYTTSAKSDENLKLSFHEDAGETIGIPPRSVVTVVMTF